MACILVHIICILRCVSLAAASDLSDLVSECSSDYSQSAIGSSALLQRSVKAGQLHASWTKARTRWEAPDASDQRTSLEVDLEGARKGFDFSVTNRSVLTEPGSAADVRKVAFLFMVKDGLAHEAVWDAFFEQAPKDTFSIYAHLASDMAMPLSRWGAAEVPQVPSRWGALAGAEVALFSHALADEANVQFLLVSDTSVPVKPFHYVYSELVSKSPTTSKICFTQNLPALVVQHHQWVVLSRKHALTFAQNAELAINNSYAAMQKIGRGCCSDELVISTALLPDLAAEDPPNDFSLLDDHLKEMDIEKACLTWVSWSEQLNGTPLDLVWWYAAVYEHNGTTLNGMPHHFGPPEDDPTVKLRYLQTMVMQEGFMFARKFNSGCLVDDDSHQIPLSEALPSLWDSIDAEKVASRVWTRLDAEGVPQENVT